MIKKNKTEEINIELLRKYFKQKCNDSEKEKVLNWFNDPHLENTLKYILRDHWKEIELNQPDSNADSERLLDKIHHILHTKEWEEMQKESFLHKIVHGFSKIAAILILPILVFSGWYILRETAASKIDKTSYAEIFSPMGARTHFELPDGSTGWLNSGRDRKSVV